MDRIAQWRPIEPAGPDGPAEQGKQQPEAERFTGWRLIVVGAVGVAALAAAGLTLWATTPQPQIVLEPLGQSEPADAGELTGTEPEPSTRAAPEDLVVDVQGAVERPGVHLLPAGSRVGDAISAAGGYSTQVDIAAAAQRLNLAQRVQDGEKIHVPARGEQVGAVPPVEPAGTGDPAPAGPNGPINLNTASTEQLDTLPGIGPVTAAKIIAAREEAPFNTVDELLSRGVVGPATFEKISGLVTTGP